METKTKPATCVEADTQTAVSMVTHVKEYKSEVGVADIIPPIMDIE